MSRVYTAPAQLGLNQWAFSDDWTVADLNVSEPGGSIASRFHARDLHRVMGPATSGIPMRFLVTLDG
jgi:hypothetical protein